MKFLVDNDLPPRIGRALDVVLEPEGVRAVALRDKFGTGKIQDETWINVLGDEGDWVVITGDRRIIRTPHLRQAFRQAHLIGFFAPASWSKMDAVEKTWRILASYRTMARVLDTVDRPALYQFPARQLGKLKQIPFPG